MKTLPVSIALALALVPALAPAAFEYETDKIPVLVMPSEVTVDGEERPALGRSFTDTLTGGLLRSGGFSVIDYLSSGAIAAELASAPTGRPPEASASHFGQMTGAHLVYVPRLVVEEDFLKMTIKKIRVIDGSVLAVYETEARGERATMFTLAENLLGQIYAELARERAGKSAAERRSRKARETPAGEPGSLEIPLSPDEPEIPADSPPAPPDEVAEVAPPAEAPTAEAPTAEAPPVETTSVAPPPPLAMAAKKPARKVPATQDIGTVTSVNHDYGFCILNVPRGVDVAVGDELRVLIEDPLVPIVKLRVSKIDGRQAVAERVSGAPMERLIPGQRAFRMNRQEP